MDDDTRIQIILAGVSMAGARYENESPAVYQARIGTEVARVAAWSAPESNLSKLVDAIQGAKKFVAVIDDVEKEEKSKRGFVHLTTRPSKQNEDGKEHVRTERIDTPEGVAMVRAVRALKGHRALLFVEMQETAEGRKVRVLKHVEDLGEAR